MSRYAQEINVKLTLAKKISFLLLPCVSSLILYRFSHYFFQNKHYLIARFIYSVNIITFGLDIAPSSSIGAHVYIPHPVGIIIIGKTGDFCTFFAQAAIGGGVKEIDIGAGPGLPILEDNVTISAGAMVLGAVTIGSNATIGAKSLAITSVPENRVLFGVPGKLIKAKKTTSL